LPELRPYQQEDVDKLLTLPAAGVFNEQRTGKTPTAIMTMMKRGVLRLLVICPASLVYSWQTEYKIWTGQEAMVIDSAKLFLLSTDRPREHCIIINYENFRDTKVKVGCVAKLLRQYKPDGLIVDEAHRCKNRKSENYKAISKCRHIDYRLYLTGTPAPNQPWDVWSILHFINPERFSSFWNFVAEYFEQEEVWVGGNRVNQPVSFKSGMRTELQKVLNELCIMRKREDVMTWLQEDQPPIIIKLPCTPIQQKYIKDLEQYFETEHINTQSVIEQLIRIRQISSAPAILNLKGSSPKIDWLKKYIADYPEKSIIIFSNSKRFIYLVKAFVVCGVITGDTPPKERQQHIVSFQNGTTRVLILQTQAGKEGLTLDRADTTIFLDTFPPAADYLQAKDRMVPTKPENVKSQEIVHLMMKGTYDEQLYKLVEHRVSDTEVVNDYIKFIKERRNLNG
jgi:SNF2 family DNA or RNA helicase